MINKFSNPNELINQKKKDSHKETEDCLDQIIKKTDLLSQKIFTKNSFSKFLIFF